MYPENGTKPTPPCGDACGTLPECAPLAVPYVPFQQNNPKRYEQMDALSNGTLYPGLNLPFRAKVDAAGVPVCETPNGEIALEEGEYELINRVEEENAQEAANSVSAALPTGGFVILDTELNDDLLAEGYARDVIRAVQEARKAAGLEISDRITLKVTVPADDVAKVEQFKDLVAHDTSSDSVSVEAGAELGVEVAKV